MTKSDKKEKEDLSKNGEKNPEVEEKQKESTEDKLKAAEEKLLRTLAEMENQRRRFEKERQEAFEFGGFNFARESLTLLDNIERAINSFISDDS